jgi:uncharacterized protein (DUF2267 family)
MSVHFEKYAAKGNEVLAHLDRELGSKGTEHAGRVLRAVLHALRNRITPQESIQFISQLPMAIKALYVDGWKMSTLHKSIHTIDELSDEVIMEGGRTAWRDFSGKADAMLAVRAVMKVLAEFISPGEFADLAAVLPKGLDSEVRSWGDLKSPMAVQE